MQPHERIIHAVDVSNVAAARTLVEEVMPHVGVMKLGLEFQTFVFGGLWGAPNLDVALEHAQAVFELSELIGNQIMYDGKFADIDKTMEGATGALSSFDPWGFTVHASIGPKALVPVGQYQQGSSSIAIAVTVLTSIDADTCVSIFGTEPNEKVVQFARMAMKAGIRALVCAPAEAALLRTMREFDDLLMICPGIRPEWSWPEDQDPDRVMTPEQAIASGVDYLVIGSPIRLAVSRYGLPSRADACRRIAHEIARGLELRGS